MCARTCVCVCVCERCVCVREIVCVRVCVQGGQMEGGGVGGWGIKWVRDESSQGFTVGRDGNGGRARPLLSPQFTLEHEVQWRV